MEINNLSDEVLVIIFSYVDVMGKYALSKTCERFYQIMLEKKLSRSLDVSGCYKVTNDMLKEYLKPKKRYENIHHFNIKNCYWLSSQEIFTCVVKMKNLHSLNVVGSGITIKCLGSILSCLTQLKCLSYSCTQVPFQFEPEIISTLNSLEYLFLQDNDGKFLGACSMLKHCSNLTELWIDCFVKEHVAYEYDHHRQAQILKDLRVNLCLTSLTTLVIQIRLSPRSHHPRFVINNFFEFLEVLHLSCINNNNWKIYWVDVDKCLSEPTYFIPPLHNVLKATALRLPNMMQDLRNFSDVSFPNIKCLELGGDLYTVPACLLEDLHERTITHLSWNYSSFKYQFPETLTHLAVNGCYRKNNSASQNINTVGSLMNLEYFKASFCAFCENYNPVNVKVRPSSLFHREKERISHVTRNPIPGNKLELFTDSSPYVKHVLFTKCDMNCFSQQQPAAEELASLINIAKWTQLETLSLIDIKIPDPAFLIQIAKSCQSLQCLSLILTSDTKLYSYFHVLVSMLKHCKNLRNFSWIELSIGNVNCVIRELHHCSLLERVLIISPDNTFPLDLELTLQLITSCPFLVMFFCGMPSVTRSAKTKFSKMVRARFKEARPSLWAKIEKSLERTFDSLSLNGIPHVHYEEMFLCTTKLQVSPAMLKN